MFIIYKIESLTMMKMHIAEGQDINKVLREYQNKIMKSKES